MSINYLAICGRLGRYTQLLKDAREALQEAYKIHKDSVAKYDECLDHANKQADLCRASAKAATAELDYWSKRALAAEAELFNLKNKS